MKSFHNKPRDPRAKFEGQGAYNCEIAKWLAFIGPSHGNTTKNNATFIFVSAITQESLVSSRPSYASVVLDRLR